MRSQTARSLPPLLLLLFLIASGSPAHAATMFTRLGAAATRVWASTSAANGAPVHADPGAALLTVDRDAVAAFRAARGGRLSLPDADGGSVELDLEPLDMLAPGVHVTYTDDHGRHPFTPDVSLFRGHVAGDPKSWVVLSMGGSGVLGTVERNGRRWTLSPTQRMATGTVGLGVHAFAPEGSLAEAASRFECGINADNEHLYEVAHPERPPLDQIQVPTPDATQLAHARFNFNIAVDNDFEIYNNKFAGDLNAATSYILTVLGTVNLIYERDLEATLKLSYLNFWTTAADPYTQSTTGAELTEMQGYWDTNNGGISRNVAHLISGRPLGGGIAYIDAICGGAPGYGLSAIDALYSYPTATTTWDVEVIAHELGHNFGSYHTHSCNWQAQGRIASGTTIDSCQASEGGCASYTNHLPPNKGTIMSYCHLISSVANGVRLDFHPVCVTRMVQVMTSCGSFASPAPPFNPSATNITTGARLSWLAGGSSGVLRYSVVRSRFPLDLNPAYIGNTTLTQFDTPGLGTYYYRVRAVRSTDSSATCAELKATLCTLAAATPVPVGSQPNSPIAADLNGDGILDVTLVTQGDNKLVTLLGQGSGGVGNGTFAPPASIATGTTPVCLALLDVNADGILDAIVGAQGDNTLQLHLGQGTGGVGNGTFGAATQLATLPFSPTAIAVGDFDEDGIADLAVAGGGSSIVTLRGLGNAGVPNGAFDTTVTVNTVSQSRGLLVYDWNGDGIPDLAVSGSGIRMLFGNGTGGKGDGTFALGPSYSAGATPNAMCVADLNADGIADLAVCNSGASSVSVLLGGGSGGVPDGTFAPAIPIVAGSGPSAVSAGDWNADGIPDLAVASTNGGNNTSILLGKGDGTFEAAQTFVTGAASGSTALALNDFNGDGTPDLMVLSRFGASATRQQSGCVGVLSTALAVVSPNGGETWVGDTEHTISWTKGAGVLTVDLQRSDDGGVHWRTLGGGLTGTSYAYTVTAPWTTTARMRVVDSQAAQFADASNANFTVQEPVQVGVGEDHPTLALLGAWPNPAHADLSVALSLPADEAHGALELLDLSGRRVAFRDLSGLSAGRHQVTLLERHALAPGVYLVRLQRGEAVKSLKVAVLH